MFSCSVNDSETSAEIDFEIHTIEHPNVQFNLKLNDAALSLVERERKKKDDITVIKLTLAISGIPFDIISSNYRLILTSIDNKIQPLTIPVVCYRPLRQTEIPNKGSASALSPQRAGLGVLRTGEQKQFLISGPPELLRSIKIDKISGFPENIRIEMSPDILPDNIRSVVVFVDNP